MTPGTGTAGRFDHLRGALREFPPLLWSFLYFFFLLTGYYVLRPVRDAMGASDDVQAVFPPGLVEWAAARGLVLGDLVAALIAASAGGLAGASTLARAGKGGVVLLAVFMSLQELGVATDIVTTAFAIIFGAIALALALSFGLGNRELAGEVTRRWYEDWRHEREALRKASEQAESEQPSAEPR